MSYMFIRKYDNSLQLFPSSPLPCLFSTCLLLLQRAVSATLPAAGLTVRMEFFYTKHQALERIARTSDLIIIAMT